MRRFCLKSRSFIIALILLLLAGQTSVFGYVWCVTGDGHVALEGARAGDCSLDDRRHAGAESSAAALDAETDDCGPCLDVAATAHWNLPRSRHDVLPDSVAVDFTPVVAAARDFPIEHLPDVPRPIEAPLRIPLAILHHRTVVLLI